MIRHLFKLVWNRKRANALLLLEIFFSFLVVFGVATLGLFTWSNYRRPLGFEWHDVWDVALDVKQDSDDTWTPEQVERFNRLLAETRALPQVVAVAGSLMTPFGFNSSNGGWTSAAGRDVRSEVVEVSADYDRVMGIQVEEGRWFEPSDAAQPWRAAVVSRSLARELYGDASPLGKPVRESEIEERIVGVISDFRRAGELSIPDNIFLRLIRDGNPADRPGRHLAVRVRPGTPAAFEEDLVRRMQAVAPDWSFEVQPLSRLRDSAFRFRLAPVALGGIIAFFLLSMVALGLLGVLWQSLLRRTREMGLRRAAGASALAVQRQVLLEQVVLTTLGVALGLVLVLQLPLLGVVHWVGKPVFAGGIGLAVLVLYGLTTLCGLYPSWMARRLQPAEALRYE